ncbi:Glyoxalase-like domain protein [Ruegeria denitrificans]|uniref:Bleomycin resistance protein n=1 Tax=Ruegeria denitrificans TaxID=1715692 RepID=A0A0P1ITF0_9RHOB|nr:VOC family protein [Ruegeria denitrificans]CUK04057.1 Glyoxalase-like domain protein [Ruegeria denitrificans]
MTFRIEPLVPELWCTDFEKSMAFYTETIGFEVAQQRGQDPHAYLSLNQAQIMIAHWTIDGSWEPWFPKSMERPFGRGINFQFMVDNVQDLYDRVRAKGIKPFVEIHDAEDWKTDCMDTRRQFIVLDPDGYLLRFAQSVSTRAVTDSDHKQLNQKYGTSFL